MEYVLEYTVKQKRHNIDFLNFDKKVRKSLSKKFHTKSYLRFYGFKFAKEVCVKNVILASWSNN